MESRCPCDKECIDRSGDCHATCKRYIDWKREHEEARKQFRQKNRNPTSRGRWVKTQEGYWRIVK